jgi:hypothetical protein
MNVEVTREELNVLFAACWGLKNTLSRIRTQADDAALMELVDLVGRTQKTLDSVLTKLDKAEGDDVDGQSNIPSRARSTDPS